ncbi:hypothetical protein FACS1894180_7920 [Bacteroidia bacterium]|nr:hypothetical protein FACS1894180_7920 [Bacteroidia bacterium]
MTKNMILFLVSILLCLNACLKSNTAKLDEGNIGVSENITNEIKKIIKNNNFSHNANDSILKVLSVYLFKSPQEYCKIIMSINFGIDSTRFCGYTEMDNKPVVFYIMSDSCISNLFDKELLSNTKQLLPHNSILFNMPDRPFPYEVPVCLYLVKDDSLILESYSRINLGIETIKFETIEI